MNGPNPFWNNTPHTLKGLCNISFHPHPPHLLITKRQQCEVTRYPKPQVVSRQLEKMAIRNEARRAQLAGRPCLHQYRTATDQGGLVDKKTFQRMYERKWSGAPWMVEETSPTGTGDAEIILDQAPASSPSSSVVSSQTSSRRTTLEDEYVPPSPLVRKV